jgi:hypothetical protein
VGEFCITGDNTAHDIVRRSINVLQRTFGDPMLHRSMATGRALDSKKGTEEL